MPSSPLSFGVAKEYASLPNSNYYQLLHIILRTSVHFLLQSIHTMLLGNYVFLLYLATYRTFYGKQQSELDFAISFTNHKVIIIGDLVSLLYYGYFQQLLSWYKWVNIFAGLKIDNIWPNIFLYSIRLKHQQDCIGYVSTTSILSFVLIL